MKLISLLGVIATIASGYSLENSEIEEEKIAEIATDIFVEQQGNRLVFKKISEDKVEITSELLNSDFSYAPYILFTYKDDIWFAEQTDSLEYFKRMLRFKESENSLRCGIIGADRINASTDRVEVFYDILHQTKLIELVCK